MLGYNPHKPGRPSHTYHSYFIANLRLVLDVEVQPGNQHHSKYSAPGLWALLEQIGRARWPRRPKSWPPAGSTPRSSTCGSCARSTKPRS